MDIKCPITDLIFLNPVLASDGYFYEKNAIRQWVISSNSSSPMTRANLLDHFYESIEMKQYIENYLRNYPDKLATQYITSNKCKDNLSQISDALRAGKYTELLDYVEFDFGALYANSKLSYGKLFECNDELIVDHVIKNTLDLNFHDIDRWLPIHYACSSDKNLVFTKALLNNAVDMENVNLKEYMPIHISCFSANCIKTMKYLIKNNIYSPTLLTKSNKCLLHIVLLKGSRMNTSEKIDKIKFLVKHGCDINHVDNDGNKPFHLAFYNDDMVLIKYITSLNIDINDKRENGSTVLHIACCILDNDHVVKFLIDCKIDINYANDYGHIALHEALSHNNYSVAKLLIEHGSNLEAKTNFGSSPFDFACQKGSLRTIKMLIKNGVNMLNKENKRRNAMFWAAEFNEYNVIKYLMKTGIYFDSIANDRVKQIGKTNDVEYADETDYSFAELLNMNNKLYDYEKEKLIALYDKIILIEKI